MEKDEKILIREMVDKYRDKKLLFELFLKNVQADFSSSPALNTGVPSIIHSTKSRLKDEGHLSQMLVRFINR